ncbi:hypothetical protein [Winogradskyella sp.]|uniref:hypothetical protein n=1 Tax=Winogradskyella sp. TaxID=1883156 RepID=UPI00260DC26A|nr:hypothetical protein [Winogradskyella sp.]
MIKIKSLVFLLFLTSGCQTGNLEVIADLPLSLNEVSGIAIDKYNKVIWMVNDSGNKPLLFGIDGSGNIAKTIKVKAKNRDWEDLTMDPRGNLYIGNFGNNDNDSKGLSILKIAADSLKNNPETVIPEVIRFKYPEQKKFPPKKNKRHFDCEAFFFYKDSLYLFTKSRSSKHKGKTNLYSLPASKGSYEAKFKDTFNTCEESKCWVTSADINAKGDKMAVLTENSVFVFSNLNTNAFLKSEYKRYPFSYDSQKESVTFKNDSTLYIADEYLGVDGGNLYSFKID